MIARLINNLRLSIFVLVAFLLGASAVSAAPQITIFPDPPEINKSAILTVAKISCPTVDWTGPIFSWSVNGVKKAGGPALTNILVTEELVAQKYTFVVEQICLKANSIDSSIQTSTLERTPTDPAAPQNGEVDFNLPKTAVKVVDAVDLKPSKSLSCPTASPVVSEWAFSGDTESLPYDPKKLVNFDKAGTYSITLTQSCGGGASAKKFSVTKRLTVIESSGTTPPASGLDFTWSPVDPWTKQKVLLSSSGGCTRDNPINRWTVTKPPGVDFESDIYTGIGSFTPQAEGDYIVKLTQTCNGTKTPSKERTIVVRNKPGANSDPSKNTTGTGQCAALPADFGAALAEFAKQAGEVFSKKEIDSINDLAEKSGLASALLTIGKGSASALQAADAFARYAKQSENLNIEQFLKDLSTIKVASDKGDVTTVILTAPSVTGQMGAFMDFLKAAMDSGVAITDLLSVHWPAIKAELDKIRADYPEFAQQL